MRRSNSSVTRSASSGGAGARPFSSSVENSTSASAWMVLRRAGLKTRRPHSRLSREPPFFMSRFYGGVWRGGSDRRRGLGRLICLCLLLRFFLGENLMKSLLCIARRELAHVERQERRL